MSIIAKPKWFWFMVWIQLITLPCVFWSLWFEIEKELSIPFVYLNFIISEVAFKWSFFPAQAQVGDMTPLDVKKHLI